MHQVCDSLLRLLVEQIQADPVLALSNRLRQLRLQLNLILLLDEKLLLKLLLLEQILLMEDLLLLDRRLLLPNSWNWRV